jgi:hypothetical protein
MSSLIFVDVKVEKTPSELKSDSFRVDALE